MRRGNTDHFRTAESDEYPNQNRDKKTDLGHHHRSDICCNCLPERSNRDKERQWKLVCLAPNPHGKEENQKGMYANGTKSKSAGVAAPDTPTTRIIAGRKVRTRHLEMSLEERRKKETEEIETIADLLRNRSSKEEDMGS